MFITHHSSMKYMLLSLESFRVTGNGENMKQMSIIMKTRDMRDKHRLLFSVVLVTVLLALTWTMIPITFETSDDAFMMSCLSGGKTGKPQADTIFSLFLWGRAVSALYLINAGIPWYTLIFLSLVALSLMTICYCVVSSFPEWGGSLFCLLYFCMFLYYSVIIQFTMISAYCGVAAVSLMLIGGGKEDRKQIIIKNAIIFFFAFFAFNIRSKVGYLILGNAAFAVCLEILKYLIKVTDKRKIRNMAVSFFIMCIAAGISIGTNSIHESTDEWQKFREYHVERANFTDYSKLEYETNKDLFDEIGWSEKFYELVQQWFFMDETVNAETFRQINERNVHGSIRVGRSLLREWFPKIDFQVKAWVLLLLFLGIDAVRHRAGRFRKSIVSLLWLVVWFAETQYFGYTGRVMERAFEAWTLLAVIPSVLGVSGDCPGTEERAGERHNSAAENVIVSVLALALCIVCVWHSNGGYTRAKTFALARDEIKITQAQIEDYAMEHSENLYITGTSLSREGGPWRVYTESLPYNLIFWGGSAYNSPLYYAQLRKNGLEHIFMEDFFGEKICFIAREEPDESLYAVMEEKFPGCVCEVIDEKDGFIVYRYTK